MRREKAVDRDDIPIVRSEQDTVHIDLIGLFLIIGLLSRKLKGHASAEYIDNGIFHDFTAFLNNSV
jgi:hypothetical protein